MSFFKSIPFLALSCAAFALPAMSVSFTGGFYTVAVLLVVMSWALLPALWSHHKFQASEYLLLVSLVFYPGLVLVDLYVRQGQWSWPNFQESSRFLLVIPVFLMTRKYGFNEGVIKWGVLIGAVAAGSWAYYQKNFLGIGRVWGGTSHLINAFGDISLLLGILSVVLFQPKWSKDKRWWLLVILALAFGLFGSLASGAKGGWISLPVLAWLLVDLSAKPTMKKRIAVVTMLMVMAGMVWYVSPFIQSRTSMVIPAITTYVQTGTVFDGSAGIRLALWHGSWLIFVDNPLFGVGLGNFYEHLMGLIEAGRLDPQTGSIHHPHSQFFYSLASLGLWGPIAVFSIYTAFIWHCKLHIVQNKALSIAGIVICFAYMDFGLVELIWDINNAGVFFTMMMALISGKLSFDRNKISTL